MLLCDFCFFVILDLATHNYSIIVWYLTMLDCDCAMAVCDHSQITNHPLYTWHVKQIVRGWNAVLYKQNLCFLQGK